MKISGCPYSGVALGFLNNDQHFLSLDGRTPEMRSRYIGESPEAEHTSTLEWRCYVYNLTASNWVGSAKHAKMFSTLRPVIPHRWTETSKTNKYKVLKHCHLEWADERATTWCSVKSPCLVEVWGAMYPACLKICRRNNFHMNYLECLM